MLDDLLTLDDQERILPDLAEGDGVVADDLAAAGHETQPPARYTEASLVKRLEELGVGRPSTYASTISTIQDRGYVRKQGTTLLPTFTAFAVVDLHGLKLVILGLITRDTKAVSTGPWGDADFEDEVAAVRIGLPVAQVTLRSRPRR